jgi:hypothetical protein
MEKSDIKHSAVSSTPVGQTNETPDIVLYSPLIEAVSPIVTDVFGWLIIVFVFLVFRKRIVALLDSLTKRVSDGAELSFGGITVGNLPIERTQLSAEQVKLVSDLKTVDVDNNWTNERERIYDKKRKLYLYHILEPTSETGNKYNVTILIGNQMRVGDQKSWIQEIVSTEFFFGKFWGNEIFDGRKIEGTYGVTISAYGNFLAICRVTFSDSSHIILDRFVDFAGIELSKINK